MKSIRFVLVLACALGYSSSVYAYLDPGTGSALIQGLIAAIAAIGVTAKLYWHRLIAFFGRNKTNEPNSSDADPVTQTRDTD